MIINSILRFVLFILLVFSLSKTSVSQPTKELFNIPTDSIGLISGTHYIPVQPNQKLVLFSGGCNSTQTSFQEIAKELAGEGFDVITYDLRGHGESTARLTGEAPDPSKPPIHSQETHDGLEKFHSQDLELVYSNFKELASNKEIILSLSGCTTSWSFEMLVAHPEIKSLLLLSTYFGEGGADFLDARERFNLFVATTEESRTQTKLLKDFLNSNQNHSVNTYSCKNGYADKMLVECPDLNQTIIKWVKSL